MKTSEARILTFLEGVDDRFKFARRISSKLNMDYGYLIRILGNMKDKQWVKAIRRENKVFYQIKDKKQIENARLQLTKKEK